MLVTSEKESIGIRLLTFDCCKDSHASNQSFIIINRSFQISVPFYLHSQADIGKCMQPPHPYKWPHYGTVSQHSRRCSPGTGRPGSLRYTGTRMPPAGLGTVPRAGKVHCRTRWSLSRTERLTREGDKGQQMIELDRLVGKVFLLTVWKSQRSRFNDLECKKKNYLQCQLIFHKKCTRIETFKKNQSMLVHQRIDSRKDGWWTITYVSTVHVHPSMFDRNVLHHTLLTTTCWQVGQIGATSPPATALSLPTPFECDNTEAVITTRRLVVPRKRHGSEFLRIRVSALYAAALRMPHSPEYPGWHTQI